MSLEGHVVVIEDPSPEDRRAVDDGLQAHAAGHGAPLTRKRLAVLLKDEASTTLAGALAYWYPAHGTGVLEDLWVADALRGRGAGRLLVQRTEGALRERGCELIHLDTFEFQAPGFYDKLGYQIFGSLTYPGSGRVRYFLSKNLNAPPDLERMS